MSDTISYELDEGVAVVRMDDGKANVFSHAALEAVHGTLDRAEADGADAVVFAGRTGQFSGGFDLKEFAKGAEATRDLVIAGGRLLNRLFLFPRPTVVAVTGNAIAAGAIFCLVTDHNIGAEGSFKMGLPETAIKMALPAYALEFARYRLDPRRFTEATLMARLYDPAGALQAGYLDLVVPPEECEATAIAEAKRLTSTLSPGAWGLSKERARADVHRRVDERLVADVTSLTTGFGG